MKRIAYQDGYKYQLTSTYAVSIPIMPQQHVQNDYIHLSIDGRLTIRAGYAWDGPSGPTKVMAMLLPAMLRKAFLQSFMRGSLVHDALYQLMREGKLDRVKWREPADQALQTICIEDGMSKLRAWWIYHGVRLGGGPSADPTNKRPLKLAP